MPRRRIDVELFEQGHYDSIEEATRAVMAGEVLIDTVRITKPGHQVEAGVHLTVNARRPYVSRGGEKLTGALEDFGLDIAGLHALDVGTSTGGFTDCLLARGVDHVTAVDVGYGQFAWKLRQDGRVSLHERTNIVDLRADELVRLADLVVADVSFTSLAHIIPSILELVTAVARFVLLVKPQFEAEPDEIGEGGVIRERGVHERVLGRVIDELTELGLAVEGVTNSPIKGPKGNREFFVSARVGSGSTVDGNAIIEAVDSAWQL